MSLFYKPCLHQLPYFKILFLNFQPGVGRINIHTDSKFVIQCVTEWMPKWKKNGWLTFDKKPVKNKEMLEKLDKSMQSMDKVSWVLLR